MGKKAEEYKNQAAVINYKEMTRKVGVLSRITVRQLLGTRPETDPRTEYMTTLEMRVIMSGMQQEVLLELAITKLGLSRDDFLKAMTEKMQETVKAFEDDLCVQDWDDAGNPIFDLAKYAERTKLWPR
jgi:hypothetical protein